MKKSGNCNSSKILFISHHASRTGAPLVLLNFLRWFKENTAIPFHILLRKGGELEPEFRDLAPVSLYVYQPPIDESIIGKIGKKLKFYSSERKKQRHQKSLLKKLSQENLSLIYSNTITNGDILEALSILNCPVISHVHELEFMMRHYSGARNLRLSKKHTQHYIAVAQAVKDNLIENHNISAEVINTTFPFIETTKDLIDTQKIRLSILEKLEIPKDAKVVCGSGTIDWRKGSDLFIQLAYLIYQKYTDFPVYFLWVGGNTKGLCAEQVFYDVNKLELTKFIRFLGIQKNPLDYFAACDVFALVSREDPFPLVCLEAASVGKPIVCFDEAGGEKEFVENDCGIVVPYLDLEEMANQIVYLFKSPELCGHLGEKGKQKVKERHDIQVIAPQLLEVIKKFIS